ncbi:MAG: MgtC/SapB family protein [Gemmatimonas sp.]
MDLSLAFDLLVAALVGLAVGLEREWSGHATGPDARFAGLRTFALLGAIGGFGGWFMRLDQPVIAACLIGGSILFVIVAYAATMRRPGSTADGTTEIAAILVVAMGAAAGNGHRALASAAGALIVVLLAEKSVFQRWMQRIDAAEWRATLQFAVMALVVLPILPAGAYGPFDAFHPRQLWWVVLLFSALNFAGYIARRLVGETRGLGITGLLGGLVSSTAVTFTFSRRSRQDTALALPLAFGVAAACTVLLPRLIIMATVLQPSLFGELLPLLAPPFLVGVGLLVFVFWRERETRPSPSTNDALNQSTPAPSDRALHNPLALATSIQMAIAFQVVLFVIAWVHTTVGNPGVLASAGLLGLTDMDALTLSMSRFANDATQIHVAALAIGIGVIANSLLKLLVVLVLGGARFRLRASVALLLLAACSGLTLWWRW